jgi:hypothetical protein
VANKFTDAVFRARLSGMRKLALWVLASRANNDTGVCWPSYARIADDAGIGATAAKDAVRFLIEAGLVTIVGKVPRHGSRPTNKYELHLGNIQKLSQRDGAGDAPTLEDGAEDTLTTGRETTLDQGGRRSNVGAEDDRELLSNSSSNSSKTNPSSERGKYNTNTIPLRESIHFSADAEELARYFHDLLESNNEVYNQSIEPDGKQRFIAASWDQTFPRDLDLLLQTYTKDQVKKIIAVSQSSTWRKYILRSESLVKNAAKILRGRGNADKEQPAEIKEDERADPFEKAESFQISLPPDDEEDFG